MSLVNLPLCNVFTEIDSALAQLHEARRGAVVTFRAGDLCLVTADELALARYGGFKRIAEVAAIRPLAADEPVNIWMSSSAWMGSSAPVTYQVRFGARELSILAPDPVQLPDLRSFMESLLLEPVRSHISWQSLGVQDLPGFSYRRRPAVFDDIVTGRFDHPLADVRVGDEIRVLLGRPPEDYYCTGDPRHDDFFVPVQAGNKCPYNHTPPAVIVSSR